MDNFIITHLQNSRIIGKLTRKKKDGEISRIFNRTDQVTELIRRTQQTNKKCAKTEKPNAVLMSKNAGRGVSETERWFEKK